MTILAVRLLGPERAVMWCDSEFTAENERPIYRNKLTVNALAGLACATGGWKALGDEAHRVATGAQDLDTAVRLLPEALRQKTAKLINGPRHFDPRETGWQTTLIAGWSGRFGRIVAFAFRGENFFEAVLSPSFAWPTAPEFERLREPVAEHVVRIARAQMDALRVTFPSAVGGVLTAAVLQPGMVTARALYDLAADAPLWTPGMIEARALIEEEAA